MAEFVKVASVDEIAPGERMWIEFEEETVILINVKGQFFCIADLCSHDDGPLEDGTISDFEIECPRHGARFDIRTGKALCLPATSPIPFYQVKVEDGAVLIESPDA